MNNHHTHRSISFVCLSDINQVATSSMKRNLHTQSTHDMQFQPICHHNLIQGTCAQLLSAQAVFPPVLRPPPSAADVIHCLQVPLIDGGGAGSSQPEAKFTRICQI